MRPRAVVGYKSVSGTSVLMGTMWSHWVGIVAYLVLDDSQHAVEKLARKVGGDEKLKWVSIGFFRQDFRTGRGKRNIASGAGVS